jgi:hypothetical protein
MSKAEILEELPRLAGNERREILERLWDMEEVALTEYHQGLVDEALHSGPAVAGTAPDWQRALQRGLARGQAPA